MALPEQFLSQNPEQQEAAVKAALKAYHEAPPGQEKQKGREALMQSQAPPQK